MKPKINFAVLVLVLLSASLACQFAAEALEPIPTETPRPPDTATPTITTTPLPPPDRQATSIAAATNDAISILATALPDLDALNLNGTQGQLVYAGPQDMTIAFNGGGFIYDPLDEDLILKNFMLGVDVTWNSETGFAGCGIIFRADPDFQTGEQVVFNTIRLSGFPGWDIELHDQGGFRANLTGGIKTSGAIDQHNGATNHYVISANGYNVTIYANGQRLGSATLTERRFEGTFAFFAFGDRDVTRCIFSNAWILELPD